MKKVSKKARACIFCTLYSLSMFSLAGCVTKNNLRADYDVSHVSTEDFVARQLAKAVEEAHSQLAQLSDLRGKGIEVLIPPPDPKLAKEISISWTGSPETLLKNICLEVGYQYKQIGSTAQEIPIVVYGEKAFAYHIIEDLALQIYPKATVKVDTIGQIITLAYPVVN